MRLDLPHERPRRSTRLRSTQPLEPSPVEKRQNHLSEGASEYDGPKVAPERRANHVPGLREPGAGKVAHEPTVERRSRRDGIPNQRINMPLREEERKILADVGRFRVVTTRDLAETIYGHRQAEIDRDLISLRQKGLVEVDAVNPRRGRQGKLEHIAVVTLTRAGSNVARQTSGLPLDQKFYDGLVKLREVEHDAKIYRAYWKESQRIEQKGGTNLRVQLDFELKSQVQKAIYAERKADPERDMEEIRQQVAQRLELPFVNRSIRIPDARIQYDMDQGSRTGHEDIEVLTAKYGRGYLRAKAQSGFRSYASSSDRAAITAKIEDDHGLMQGILEL